MADDEAFARQLQAQLEAEQLSARQARLQEEAALVEAEFELASQAVLERERAEKQHGESKQQTSAKK
ncbi:hypothetical protein PLESTM_001261300 [Pleodorina starrii]|nr:hypothetical protein PLESTM_001261300 [Pleodorina starrii]